jgi:ParB/RepB/Spo0J family partition protein
MTSSTEVIQYIPIALLTPHPDNPRIVLREDVIEAIVTQLKERGVFHERYAPLVRPVEGGYQVISGHHRVEAARRAAILTVPCWTVDLDDEEAFFQVLLANNQGELSPLERGLHACTGLQTYSRNGANVKKYADRVGATTGYISQIRQAANVYRGIQERFSQLKLSQLTNKAQHLYAIHKAPKETWTQLAQALLDHDWSGRPQHS